MRNQLFSMCERHKGEPRDGGCKEDGRSLVVVSESPSNGHGRPERDEKLQDEGRSSLLQNGTIAYELQQFTESNVFPSCSGHWLRNLDNRGPDIYDIKDGYSSLPFVSKEAFADGSGKEGCGGGGQRARVKGIKSSVRPAVIGHAISGHARKSLVAGGFRERRRRGGKRDIRYDCVNLRLKASRLKRFGEDTRELFPPGAEKEGARKRRISCDV
ncbi:hypothetical protein KM043_010891 [Ampulex compressa]|nr:hypothetical protein KM043_010891 [Ampulex compressa]